MGMFSFPKFDIKPYKFDITGHEGGVIALQDLRAFEDSAIYCNFKTAPRISQIAKLISFATGIKHRVKDIFKCGERMNQLKRLISCNLGLTRKDDSLPNHVLKVLETGATAGVTYKLEENLKNYYKIRDWDWETGCPKDEKLKELGIL